MAGGIILAVIMRLAGAGEEVYYENAMWMTGVVGILAAIPMYFWYKRDRISRKIGGLVSEQERMGLLEMAILLFVGAALAQFMNMFLAMFSQILDYESYEQTMEALVLGNRIWIQIFWIGIVAPFAEEVVFRWMVYLRLRDYYRRGWAMILSGILFGVFHWNLLQAIYASVLGIAFAYILEKSGNLWSCVLLHIGANTWSLIYPELGMFLLETGQINVMLVLYVGLMALLILGIQFEIGKGRGRCRRCV